MAGLGEGPAVRLQVLGDGSERKRHHLRLPFGERLQEQTAMVSWDGFQNVTAAGGTADPEYVQRKGTLGLLQRGCWQRSNWGHQGFTAKALLASPVLAAPGRGEAWGCACAVHSCSGLRGSCPAQPLGQSPFPHLARPLGQELLPHRVAQGWRGGCRRPGALGCV